VLKLEFAIALAVLAGGAVWIEHGHRVVIDAPAAAVGPSPAAAAACPDNDTQPYDARCLEFLKVSAKPNTQVLQLVMVSRDAPAAACPDNDKVPYSASCIAFMTGATETGMRWRARDDTATAAAPQ
jgi:hypothetical protein